MFILIRPLIPLVVPLILWYGDVLDDFWAHFVALLYVAWLLTASLPGAIALRIVLRISVPVLLLAYAINSEALSLIVGGIIAIVWLLFMALLIVLARLPID